MNKIVGYGEIMMRLTPKDNNRIDDSNMFESCYGGTESNVLVTLSHLGNNTDFITKIPDNSLGEGVIRHLLKHRVGVNNIVQSGTTLGMYFMEQGFSSRPSSVIYNRKSAVINSLSISELNLDDIFKDATWFHVSGISLAISETSKNIVLSLCKEAKKRNIKISFDFNYRSTLWSLEEAKQSYKEIMSYVDVCFGNLFDLNNLLDINEKSDEATILKFIKDYNIQYLASTSRDVISANHNTLAANAYYLKDNKLVKSITPKLEFEILDRIGGGDAFVGGMIHILNQNFENIEEALSLGLHCGVLKHLVKGDVLSLNSKEIYQWINNTSKDVHR